MKWKPFAIQKRLFQKLSGCFHSKKCFLSTIQVRSQRGGEREEDLLLPFQWWRGVQVITTAQLHSSRFEFRFRIDLNPTLGESGICNSENVCHISYTRLEIRLNHTTKTIYYCHHKSSMSQFIEVVIVPQEHTTRVFCAAKAGDFN